MRIIKLNSNNINQVINNTISVLRSNGLVVFPSDTVYGLLCDATNERAVKKLILFKERPAGKPISVFSNFSLINELTTISNQQSKTLKQILPGPFTIILPSKHKVNKLLESETGTLGIRVPMYRYIELLVGQFKKPITATSANLAGRSPYYSIKSLLNGLTEKQKKLIDLVIDAGDLPRNKPSTVVDLTQSDVKVLRQGDISFSNNSKIFLTETSEETKNIAKQIFIGLRTIHKLSLRIKPLIFIIEGEMGVGKTVFVKGIGEQLGIKNIISPTFVIYYEYGNFYHFDLYNIENNEEFKHLGLKKFLKPGNILCFEWGEKAGEIINILKEKGNVIYVRMNYINEKERKITVNF
ncbi:MAG: L-threonylcarbamoyladenylate synthase [Patescibacteria group bacterium]|jgi:L-threonylcarbamoyladenylate synthase